jgi:uncharacterized protein
MESVPQSNKPVSTEDLSSAQPQLPPTQGFLMRVFSEKGRLRPIWRFFLAVVAVMLANIIAGKTAFALFGKHPLVADAAYRTLAMLILVGLFSLMCRYLDKVSGSTLAAQGLPMHRKAITDIWKGFGLGFLLIALSVTAIAVFGSLEVTATLNAVTARRAAIVVVLLLSGAMLEEVMFRGYPFQRLVESIGAWGAILLLSVLFGAVHLSNPNAGGVLSWGFFNTITVGVLLALAYLRTGALWVPFGFHFAWNFALGVVFGLPVSGLSVFSVIVRSHATGSKLLTGGNYGIEASLTGAVVIVLGIVIVLALPASRARIPDRVEKVIGISDPV